MIKAELRNNENRPWAQFKSDGDIWGRWEVTVFNASHATFEFDRAGLETGVAVQFSGTVQCLRESVSQALQLASVTRAELPTAEELVAALDACVARLELAA